MTQTMDTTLASARFPLARPQHEHGSTERPSPAGVRPWGLRHLERGNAEHAVSVAGWRYDPLRQVAVDPDGAPITVAEPTAKSITNADGDEGPNEDWRYDFCPDEPEPV